MDYNLIHAERAASLLDLRDKNVLVVGCNKGGDCKYFVDFGARSIVGVDVIDDIGTDFVNDKVVYKKISAEDMVGVSSNEFDLVYCFATMEHVPDVYAAYREFARVVRPGGYIYCVAAPLWNSKFGHHMGCIQDDPWIHLLMNRDEAMSFLSSKGHKGNGTHSLEEVINYMYNKDYFNMRPSSDYVQACGSLSKIKVLRNELEFDDGKVLSLELEQQLLKKGYSRQELLAVTHNFVGRKRKSFCRLLFWSR